MKILRITRPLSRPTTITACVGAIALIFGGCVHSDAGTRKARPAKAGADQQQAQPQKPIKLRYYGGPKYPMYPG
jgi:hypothetical protein